MNIPFMKWLLDNGLVKRDDYGMPIMSTSAAPYERLMKIYEAAQSYVLFGKTQDMETILPPKGNDGINLWAKLSVKDIK